MGKTTRKASRWMETRFKFGDSMYPEETHYFDGRYQNKIRNGHKTYMHEKIDPRSMKTLHWAEYGKWFKTKAKRTARHKAKIMVVRETRELLAEIQEEIKEYMELLEEWSEFHEYEFQLDREEYERERLQEEMDALSGYDYYEEDWRYASYDPIDDYYAY